MAPKVQGFGKALKAARLDRNLTLTEAARLFGVSIGNLSDIENSRRLPPKDFKKIEQMERVLGVEDGLLSRLAKEERIKPDIPADIRGIINRREEVAVTVLREAEEVGMDKVLEAIRRIKEGED